MTATIFGITNKQVLSHANANVQTQFTYCTMCYLHSYTVQRVTKCCAVMVETHRQGAPIHTDYSLQCPHKLPSTLYRVHGRWLLVGSSHVGISSHSPEHQPVWISDWNNLHTHTHTYVYTGHVQDMRYIFKQCTHKHSCTKNIHPQPHSQTHTKLHKTLKHCYRNKLYTVNSSLIFNLFSSVL